MQISDRSRWRYPGDSSLCESLLAEDEIRRSIESSRPAREQDSARARLLGGAVLVDPEVIPHLAAAVDRLTSHFPEARGVECFVYNAPEVNAFITTGRTRTLVAVSSAAVNHLDSSELEFVLGHELGHAIFGHMELAANQLIEDGALLPSSTMRLRAWQRAAEISADRAGLLLCGKLDAAARALFKAASGIVAPTIATSAEAFAAQWQRLLSEVVEEGSRDFWQVAHPFPPLRMKAMLLFWNACRGSSNDEDLSAVNAEIARMLAMMDPAAGEQTLHDPMLASFFFWGGLHVALADGDIHDGERRRLQSVIPVGLEMNQALAEARSEPGKCLAAFQVALQSRRRKLSAVELHRVMYGLIDVASADGHVSDDERTRLRELAAVLGVAAGACDVIINQYEREASRAN